MIRLLRDLTINIIVYIIIGLAVALMLRTIIGYTGFDYQYAFLAKKQDYIHNRVWLIAFYTHVFTSIFTLIAGFTQFSNHIQTYHRPVHRFMGRLYVIAVIFINVPAGFIMAIYANGLLPSKIAFMILDILWFYFTLKGWQAALNKKIALHRQWMIRSFALTFSAITLRSWRMILEPFIQNELSIYMMDAWLGFVPNLIFAELWIRKAYLWKLIKKP